MKSILISIFCIAVAGGGGGFAGWALVAWLGLAGVPAALVATASGLVVAVAVFSALAPLMRALGWSK